MDIEGDMVIETDDTEDLLRCWGNKRGMLNLSYTHTDYYLSILIYIKIKKELHSLLLMYTYNSHFVFIYFPFLSGNVSNKFV